MWGRSVVFLFVAIWAGVGAVWIILDWMGNPSRGVFRPSGTRRRGTHTVRRAERTRHRAENDAAIRSTLRESYGRSSLRVTWSQKRELRSLEADSELVTDPLHATAHLPELRYEPILIDAEFEDAVPEEIVSEDVVVEAPSPARWKLGDDALIPTRSGSHPSPSTIRTRVWKNHASAEIWGMSNAERMAAGRPPQRFNPIKNKIETAKVDLETATPFWAEAAVNPFLMVGS